MQWHRGLFEGSKFRLDLNPLSQHADAQAASQRSDWLFLWRTASLALGSSQLAP